MQQLQSARPLIAVGTTSCRTLESLYWIGVLLHQGHTLDEVAVSQWVPYSTETDLTAVAALQQIINYLQERKSNRLVTKTQIIIAPGYRFRMIDALVTNFHQPESTLLLLVSALIGPDWERVYAYALEHDFRFLSYGDSSLLWKWNA
ncbi:S-adenosylmethionine:tRNA ribosyltransferase-isomerase [compost metagenome]